MMNAESTYVLGNLLLTVSPLEAAFLSRDAFERLEGLSIEITFWVFCRVVREEVVGEQVGRSVDSVVGQRSSPVVSVGSDRVVVS